MIKAGIQHTNIVSVSSVLDPDAIELTDYNKKSIPHAALAYAVFARQEGDKGETIGAGVGAAWMKGKDGERKAYVVEAEGHKEESALKTEIMTSLVGIAKAENLDIIPRPGTELNTPLYGRRAWIKQQQEVGKKFEGWKSPERGYIKYLEENSNNYFRTAIVGIDKIPDDFGYVVAALVYVFDKPSI